MSTPLLSPQLSLFFKNNQQNIEAWFEDQWRNTFALVTVSVDIRPAAFKLVPVDTNLFPAGFNNIQDQDFLLSFAQIKQMVSGLDGDVKSILIIPESHTRNRFYLESLKSLKQVLMNAGFTVRIGGLHEHSAHPSSSGFILDQSILIEPLIREGDKLYLSGFEPDLILLNNDFSSGVPPFLFGIEQRMEPDLGLSWAFRSKANHFDCYNQIITEFADQFKMDGWLFNAYSKVVEGIDFILQKGLDILALAVDDLLAEIKQKYQEYGIDEKPFVAIKSDSGTYGMNVMMVHEGAEVLAMNRKSRVRMAMGKGGQKVQRLLLQEGIPTIECNANGFAAEPVIYLIGKGVLGGDFIVFMRTKGPLPI